MGGHARKRGGRSAPPASLHLPVPDGWPRDHAIIAAALDPIVTINHTGVIQSASDSIESIFGWTPAELVGRNVSTLMPEPHRSAHTGYIRSFLRTGVSNIMGKPRRVIALRKSGERFPIEISVSAVETPDSGTPAFVGIIRDCTERERLERELKLFKELAISMSSAGTLREAFVGALVRIGIATEWDYAEAWIPEPPGGTPHSDPTTMKLVRAATWVRPGAVVQLPRGSVPSIALDPVDVAAEAWRSGRSIWVSELSQIRSRSFLGHSLGRRSRIKGAAVAPVVAEGVPVAMLAFFVKSPRQEDGRLLDLVQAAIAHLGPLIQRARARDELDEHRRTLEQRVLERTAELERSQTQLQMADRLASIGTLAAGLGHDMNNVLLPVRAHLNALRQLGLNGQIPVSASKHVDAVKKSVSYLQQLADGLHFLAMDPEAATGSLDIVDLASWWDKTGVIISKAAPKHVRVAASFAPRLPAVRISNAGLTQAALNLVVNAGEAIPETNGGRRQPGLVTVWADVALGPDRCRRVRLGVTDNGVGMTNEVKRRAFEMFFTTKPRGMGTGLGLALVRRVAENAHGSVSIESELGKGTTVTLLLPVDDGDVPARSISDAKQGLHAVVTLNDPRAASLVRQVVEASGATADVGREPGNADVWITEPDTTNLSLVKRWRHGRPDGLVILFSAAPPSDAWSRFQPEVVSRPDDFESVRLALGRALNRVNS